MAPTSEDTDLVQWAFDTLVNSYEEYHEGEREGQESRPLRQFASQMPQMIAPTPPPTRPVASSSLFVRGLGGSGAAGSSREQKRTESRKQPRQEHSHPQRDSQNDLSGNLGSSDTQDHRIGRGTESRRANVRSDASWIERGPVPPPFGNPEEGKPSAEAIGCDDAEDNLIEEPKTAEEYAVWMQYYQQCADYFKQCESAMATKAGLEPSESKTVVPPATSMATAPSPQTAATSSRKASTTAAQQDTVSPLPSYAGSFHGTGSPYPNAMAAPLNSNSSNSAPLPGAGNMPQPVGAPFVGHAPHNAMHSPSLVPQGINLAHSHAAAHMASPPGPSLVGGSVFPSNFAPAQGGLPVLPGLSLGRSGALGGCSQNFGADDELANLLMAWYWSGYHTGHFAARQGR